MAARKVAYANGNGLAQHNGKTRDFTRQSRGQPNGGVATKAVAPRPITHRPGTVDGGGDRGRNIGGGDSGKSNGEVRANGNGYIGSLDTAMYTDPISYDSYL